MTTLTCHNCDTPGDGICPACHGKGKIDGEATFGAFGAESFCSMCGGSGECQTCDGTGEVEIGGEA
jgi:DnaJ-class molecular chaperone